VGDQSAHGHQNVQIQNVVDSTIQITFTGQPMPERAVTATVVNVRFGVPPVAAAFAGRSEELETLERALRVDGRALITQAITGLGGVGKTQLAARYVHTHAEEYDIVAWIHAEDGGIADLAKLVVKLGEPVEGISPTERRDLALERLAGGDERWLLVLDNVESPEQLPDCLPQAGNGRVLVTSRNRAIREFAPVLPLDVFDPETALQYLSERAQRPHDLAGAERLARALGYLPLALSHAAAYCADSGESFDHYLGLLDALPAHELFDTSTEVYYEQTVASTWRTSIAAATSEAPLAGEVLALAAHLGPDAIPKSLMHVLIDAEQPGDGRRLANTLGALARLNLAAVEDETVSVHRLLQKVVRDDARSRDDHTAATQALAALHDAFPADPSQPACWPVCEQLLAHVLALAETATHSPDAAPRLIALLNRSWLYLAHITDDRRALAVAQRTVATAADVLDAEHQQTLKARNNEAYSYLQLGRVSQAIRLFEALLPDQAQFLGAEHADALTTRNDLAGAYQEAGRLDEAIALHEQTVTDRERTLGADHPNTLASRNNLAYAYQEAGRLDEAIALHEQELTDSERVVGLDHPGTLTSRNNLALAYEGAGRLDEAVPLHERTAADLERLLGADHPHTLSSRNNLAYAYQQAGRLDEAIPLHEHTLADRELVLGADHPDTLSSRNNLAYAYQQAGRFEEAIALHEHTLADQERVLGGDHPDTLRSRRDLARARRAGGRSADVDADAALLDDTGAG
jgi:tetratricopeptide (TPR) repeat protein